LGRALKVSVKPVSMIRCGSDRCLGESSALVDRFTYISERVVGEANLTVA
jgi:hypothetical protein